MVHINGKDENAAGMTIQNTLMTMIIRLRTLRLSVTKR